MRGRPKLVVGYTTFTTPGTWVSNLSTDSVVATLSNLSYNQVVSGTLIFRPATAPTPTAGSTVSTRYNMSWTNPGGPQTGGP